MAEPIPIFAQAEPFGKAHQQWREAPPNGTPKLRVILKRTLTECWHRAGLTCLPDLTSSKSVEYLAMRPRTVKVPEEHNTREVLQIVGCYPTVSYKLQYCFRFRFRCFRFRLFLCPRFRFRYISKIFGICDKKKKVFQKK